MYDYFHGKLAEKSAQEAVVDVQGIGYKLYIPINLFGKLPEIGERAFFYVSWVVRELSQTLYGFTTKEERDLFELLMTFSGIGPKLALAIVGHFSPGDLEEAVRMGNFRALSQVPGVGKKTAERLMVDLKGKLKIFPQSQMAHSSKIQDALNALLNLGFPALHAQLAVKKALEELTEECELSALIAAALKQQ